MKKTLLALIVTGLFVAHASANQYTFTDLETSKSGTFDITQTIGVSTNPFDLVFGYNPSTQSIYNAYAEFVFLGIGSAQINLGGSTFGNSIFLAGTIGQSLLGSVLLDLGTDGKVSYSMSTSLQLVSAKLTVNAGSRVPDGGSTLTFLGLSFLGILSAQRKFTSAR